MLDEVVDWHWWKGDRVGWDQNGTWAAAARKDLFLTKIQYVVVTKGELHGGDSVKLATGSRRPCVTCQREAWRPARPAGRHYETWCGWG